MTDPDVEIANRLWRVTVSPGFGALIREAIDLSSGAPMLWTQEPQLAAPLPRRLPAGGPESIDTFWQVFAGGWFPMFPTAGFTAELEGEHTLFHGELNRLPWEVVSQGPTEIKMRLSTVRSSFDVVRTVLLDGRELRIEMVATNQGATATPYTYGEHPCFPHATFAGGWVELEASEAWVPEPPFDPERAKLRPGHAFSWPEAATVGDGPLDLSAIPSDRDARHDHVCLKLARSTIRLGAPLFERELEIEVDLDCTPYVLVWQDFGERGAFAFEPCSAPGRGVEDAIDAGAVIRLQPGDSFANVVSLRWVNDRR